MFQDTDLPILPPHLRHSFMCPMVYSQFEFRILFSDIFYSGFLDSISENQHIRVLNGNTWMAMRQKMECITCDENWHVGHQCRNSCLAFFNPYDRDDEDIVEELETKVEENIEEDLVCQIVEQEMETEFKELNDSMMVGGSFDRGLEFDTGEQLQPDTIIKIEAENEKPFSADPMQNNDQPGTRIQNVILCDSVNGAYDHYQLKEGQEIKASRCCDGQNRSRFDLNILNLSENQRDNSNVSIETTSEVLLLFGVFLEKKVTQKHVTGLSLNTDLVLLKKIVPSLEDLVDRNVIASLMSLEARKSCIYLMLGLAPCWMYLVLKQFWEAKSPQNVLFRFSFDPGGYERLIKMVVFCNWLQKKGEMPIDGNEGVVFNMGGDYTGPLMGSNLLAK